MIERIIRWCDRYADELNGFLPFLGRLALALMGLAVTLFLAYMLSGCALVTVSRSYEFQGPVYYPAVTVDKTQRAGLQ